jgi:hypothetical protein
MKSGADGSSCPDDEARISTGPAQLVPDAVKQASG